MSARATTTSRHGFRSAELDIDEVLPEGKDAGTAVGSGADPHADVADGLGDETTGSALDVIIPRWERRERHRLRVEGPPAAVIQAADELTWGEVPSFRRAMVMAGLGRTPFPKDGRVLDVFLDNGFRMLHRSDHQLVIGGIHRISRKQPIVPMGEDAAQEFRDFDRPSHILIAFDFRCAGGLLTTETRVRCTDRKARRLFTAYWLLIRTGSGGIRHVWLRGIRRRSQSDGCDGRERVGRAVFATLGLVTLAAAAVALPTVRDAGEDTVLVEAWRLFGLVMFAGIFGILAWRPRAAPG